MSGQPYRQMSNLAPLCTIAQLKYWHNLITTLHAHIPPVQDIADLSENWQGGFDGLVSDTAR